MTGLRQKCKPVFIIISRAAVTVIPPLPAARSRSLAALRPAGIGGDI